MANTGYLSYISEMLATHDAVVIPGFGGFITKYKPARISTESGQIYPPTKYIAFNQQLDIHDSAFARFLDENTAAHFSPRLFDHFIAQLKEDLADNRVIVIAKVGRLYQDFEGTTHFMPDLLNLNNDTFGLPKLDVTKGQWEKSPITKAAKEISGGSFRTAMASAATVVLLVMAAFGATKYIDLNGGNAVTEMSIIDSRSEQEAETPAELVAEIAPVVEAASHPEVEEPEAEVIVETMPQKEAIIMVGAFGSQANVDKMINTIESLDYEEYHDKRGKLTRVGLTASYSSEEELNSILINVQKHITSRAWILK